MVPCLQIVKRKAMDIKILKSKNYEGYIFVYKYMFGFMLFLPR